MSPQISTLGERFVAVAAQKRSLPGVFSEVVAQIAGLLEDAPAVWVHALEIQLNPLCLRVTNLDRFVPVRWDSFECLAHVSLFRQIWAIRVVIVVQRVH